MEQDLDDQYLADDVQKAKLKRIKFRRVFCLFPKKINFYPQTPIFSVFAKMSGIARSICRSDGPRKCSRYYLDYLGQLFRLTNYRPPSRSI